MGRDKPGELYSGRRLDAKRESPARQGGPKSEQVSSSQFWTALEKKEQAGDQLSQHSLAPQLMPKPHGPTAWLNSARQGPVNPI